MNTSTLMALAIAAILTAIGASFMLLKFKLAHAKMVIENKRKALSAEELTELIIGVPLNAILLQGDEIEIVVKTNSHPIAGAVYYAQKIDGKLKLIMKNEA